MTILSPLNIIMFVLWGMILISARLLYDYKSMLRSGLIFAMDSNVRENAKDQVLFRERIEIAKEQLLQCEGLWIPMFYVLMFIVPITWFGLLYGIGNVFTNSAAALLISAFIVRPFIMDHKPLWLIEWLIESITSITNQRSEEITKRFDEISPRMEELSGKRDDGSLTDEEDVELCSLFIEGLHLRNQMTKVQRALKEVDYYIQLQKKLSSKEE